MVSSEDTNENVSMPGTEIPGSGLSFARRPAISSIWNESTQLHLAASTNMEIPFRTSRIIPARIFYRIVFTEAD